METAYHQMRAFRYIKTPLELFFFLEPEIAGIDVQPDARGMEIEKKNTEMNIE